MPTDVLDEPTRTRSSSGVDPIIAEARERWPQCSEAEDPQREITLAAKRFRALDQWDPAIRAAREGKNALQAVAAQPARPCLTVDRLSPSVDLLSNQIKTADFAIDVLPNGHGADDETAEIIKGHLRLIQDKARDEAPIAWAAEGAIEGGFGWFRLRTEYVDPAPEGEPTVEMFDQELRLERITNNMTVYDDPGAMKPTRSDSTFRFITEDIDKHALIDRWPKDIYGDPVELRTLEEFAGTGDPVAKSWISKDKVRIAEYWRVTFTPEKWAAMPDGSIQQVDEFPKDAKVKRIVRRPKVEGYKITACQVLEKWDWLGTRIPQIPIFANELNVDGQRIYLGKITPGMDAQRMVNYTYSGAMETFALAPKSPFISAEGQTEQYKQMWETANTYNWSNLIYNPISINGTVIGPPQRQQSEPPIQAAVELMRVSEEAIQASTGIFDASLGKHDPTVRSGRLAERYQQQSDLSTSQYGQAVRMALIYAGELMIEILPKITRPGQILHVLGMDDEPEQVMVGQHFTKGPDGVPQGLAPEQAAGLKEGMAQFYDLTKGRYAVTVSVGKASATKREEGAAALGELIPHLPPEMAAVATPDFVEQLSFPGSHKIAEKLRKALPPQLQDQEEGGPDPEKQVLQQQVAQLQQAIQSKQVEEQAKQQADLEKAKIAASAKLQEAQMEIASREKIALIQASASLGATQAKIDAEDARTFVDAMENRLSKALELHMERLGKIHEAVQSSHDRAHEVGLTAMEQAHEKELEAQKHQQTLEQGQQAADLAPEPTTETE